MDRRTFVLFLLLPVMSCAKPAPLEVKDAWTRDTIGSSASAAIFMTITSPTDDRLIAASTPAAKKSDLMTMKGDANTMGMTYLKAIDIPANKPLKLTADGLHVWLAGLNQPLKAGRTFSLHLRFEKAGERQVTVSVVKPTADGPMSGIQM